MTDKLPSLVLRVVGDRKLSVDLRPALRGLSVSQTMKGASTVTVTVGDPKGELRRSGRLARACEVDLDETTWRLARVERGDDGTLTLVFEPRAVARARLRTTPRKASRSRMTRAQFIRSMFVEDKKYPVRFFSPELTRRQPLASLDSKQRDATRSPGIARGVKLTVKGAKANARQIRNAETVLSIAEDLKAPPKATLALVAACIVESELTNLSRGDRDSLGILQLRAGIHGAANARSIERSTRLFLTEGFTGAGGAIKLARENPGRTAGWVAQAVQGSAFPDRYDQYAGEARAFVDAFGGGVPNRSSYFARYEFSRGQPGGPRGENTWSAATRLADEVGWSLFEFAGTILYMSEEDLFRSRPRAAIRADDDGVLSIAWAIETNAKFPSELTVRALTDVWAAPPGSVIIIEGEGPGADGRWLVESTDRPDYFDDVTTIELVKPSRELPEPRSDVRTRDLSTDSADTPGDLRGTQVGAAYAKAVEIDRRQYDYAYGGGRSPAFQGPFDCSGFASAVLKAGDLGITTVLDTVAFGRWGQAGRGTYLTVWVKPLAGRNGHMFLEFAVDGKSEFFESGGTRGAKTGRRPNGLSTAGYQARHWPGT